MTPSIPPSGSHDTDPAELRPEPGSMPVMFDRATSDLIATRLGTLESNVAALSATMLAIRDAVLGIKAVTDAIPKAFHDSNNHFVGIKANQESLERLVVGAMDNTTEFVTRLSQVEARTEELIHDVAIIKLHQPSVNGSITADDDPDSNEPKQ